MRIGSRRAPSLLIASAKAGAEPGSIRPSAESHSGQSGSHAGSALTTRIGGSPRDRRAALSPHPRARPPRGRKAARRRRPGQQARDGGAFLEASGFRPSGRSTLREPGKKLALKTRLAAPPSARASIRLSSVDTRRRPSSRRARRSRRRTMKWPRARVWKWSAKATIDRRAADRADDRHGLGGEFLAGDDAKTRGDLGDQPRARPARHRGAEAAPGEKARAVGDRAGERGAHREIAALDRRLAGFAAEREHFEAGEARLPGRRCPPLLRARSGRSSASVSSSKSAARRRSRSVRTLRRSRRRRPPRPCGCRVRPWRAPRGR